MSLGSLERGNQIVTFSGMLELMHQPEQILYAHVFSCRRHHNGRMLSSLGFSFVWRILVFGRNCRSPGMAFWFYLGDEVEVKCSQTKSLLLDMSLLAF